MRTLILQILCRNDREILITNYLKILSKKYAEIPIILADQFFPSSGSPFIQVLPTQTPLPIIITLCVISKSEEITSGNK